jgi:hypothetical protein
VTFQESAQNARSAGVRVRFCFWADLRDIRGKLAPVLDAGTGASTSVTVAVAMIVVVVVVAIVAVAVEPLLA